MSDDELKSFKIGDHQRAKVAKAAKKEPEAEDSVSLGFTGIETALENQPQPEVAERLSRLLQSLDAFQEQATANKDKAAAKKAIAAVELTADLMDYLYQTKAQLEG